MASDGEDGPTPSLLVFRVGSKIEGEGQDRQRLLDLNNNHSQMQHPPDAAQTDERIPDELSQSHKSVILRASDNPNPLRINADDQKKWRLLCYSAVILLTIVFLALIAGLALPRALVPVDDQQWVEGTSVQSCDTHLQLVNQTVICANSASKNYTAMGAFVTNLSPLNQFLVLYLEIRPDIYGPDTALNEAVNFSLYSAQRSLSGAEAVMKVTSQISTHNISLVGRVKDLFPENRFFILYMTKLSSSDEFYWELGLQKNSQLNPDSCRPNSQIVNANFSYFTIFLRVGLFLVAFAVFVKYNLLIFKLPKDRISVEQRAVQILSVITLTFNDQLYFISVVSPNPFSSFLSAFFLWNFVAYLFILWALFLNRIRNPEPEGSTSMVNMPTGIIVFLFYALVLGYSVAYAVTQTTDHPVFSFEDVRADGVLVMEVIAFIVFSLGCVYIIYLFLYTLKFKPGRPHRHNVFMAISAAFFISTVVFFFVGGYDLYSYSASKIIFTLCFMNLYSFFLQYLYAPTEKQVRDINKESVPLVGPEEIEIPDGEVLIDMSEARTEKAKVEGKAEGKGEGSEEGRENSLSARERRKRKRKLHGMNSSKQNNGQGGTNSQIISNQDIQSNNHKDEFS